MSTQVGPFELIGTVKGSGRLQALSLKTEIEDVQELPTAGSQAQGVQARPSLQPR
jgi:hypothetical protein